MADREAARRLVGELVDAYNRKDAAAIADLYHPDVRLWSSLGEDSQGQEQVLRHIQELFRRLPDERMYADTVVTDGETVVIEVTSRGTSSKGPYEISFTEVLEVVDGAIASIKTYIDPEEVEAVEG